MDSTGNFLSKKCTLFCFKFGKLRGWHLSSRGSVSEKDEALMENKTPYERRVVELVSIITSSNTEEDDQCRFLLHCI